MLLDGGRSILNPNMRGIGESMHEGIQARIYNEVIGDEFEFP